MNDRVKRWLCTILAALGAVFFVYFVTSSVTAQSAYRHSEDDLQSVMAARGEMSHILSKEVKNQMDEVSVRATGCEGHLARREGYQRLMVENPNMVGWIRIEGIPMDHPIMQILDKPDYYYRRGFDREYSAYGVIYMDAICTIAEEETASPDYILHNYHVKNGSIFASLGQYGSEEYYKEHPFVEFDVENEFGGYEIIGAVRLPAIQLSDGFTVTLVARTEEGYGSLVRYAKKHAFHETEVDVQWPEQLPTLTTHGYTQKDERLLVVARKK